MPRDGAGTYTQPVSSVSPAVTNTTISSNDFNGLMTDISTEMTDSFDRSGKGAMLAALAMGGFKVTNLGVPTAASDGARLDTITGFALTGDVTGNPGANVVANVPGGKVTGLAAGGFATAGKVGEVIASAATVSVVTGAGSNITSISLTAGNWIIFGEENTGPAGTTRTGGFNGAISTTSSSLVPVNGALVQLLFAYDGSPTGLTAGQAISLSVGTAVVSISGTTTYFLTTQVGFSAGTMQVGGRITGVRIA